MPPAFKTSVKVRDEPGWITLGIDGRLGYPSTGDVIDVRTKQIVARVWCDGPLDKAQIALTDRPDPLGVPGLGAYPAQGRQAVGPLVERAEAAAGAERAPHALGDDLKSALG